MPDKFSSQPVIGVGVLVWRDRQLLLGERLTKAQENCWQFPGGHLEDGESVIDCARREVSEETGLTVHNLRHLGFIDKQFEMAQRNYVTLLVSCEYISGEAEVREPDKCASWQWFDYQHLPAPLSLPITRFLSQASSAVDLYAIHRASQILQDAPSDARR